MIGRTEEIELLRDQAGLSLVTDGEGWERLFWCARRLAIDLPLPIQVLNM